MRHYVATLTGGNLFSRLPQKAQQQPVFPLQYLPELLTSTSTIAYPATPRQPRETHRQAIQIIGLNLP